MVPRLLGYSYYIICSYINIFFMLEISIDSADKVSKRGDGLNVGLKIGNPVNPMDYSHSPHFLSDF